jgi:hypothetical protein
MNAYLQGNVFKIPQQPNGNDYRPFGKPCGMNGAPLGFGREREYWGIWGQNLRKWQVIRSLQYSNRAVIRKAPVYVDSVFWAGMS